MKTFFVIDRMLANVLKKQFRAFIKIAVKVQSAVFYRQKSLRVFVAELDLKRLFFYLRGIVSLRGTSHKAFAFRGLSLRHYHASSGFYRMLRMT